MKRLSIILLLLAISSVTSGYNWAIEGYAGKPVNQSFCDVLGTGGDAYRQFGCWQTKRNALAGVRGLYHLTEHWSLSAEAFSMPPNLKRGTLRTEWATGGPTKPVDFFQSPGYTMKMQTMALQVRYRFLPGDAAFRPYVAFGPGLTKTRICDQLGCSPDSLDFSLLSSVGVEYQRGHLRAFVEGRDFRAYINQWDDFGGFRGSFMQQSVVLGLGVNF